MKLQKSKNVKGKECENRKEYDTIKWNNGIYWQRKEQVYERRETEVEKPAAAWSRGISVPLCREQLNF